MTTPSVTLIKSELFRQGGLEKYTWQIARNFCELGYSLTLLTTGTFPPPFSHPLLKIVSLPIQHALGVLNVWHFDKECCRYVQENPTDIVFSLDRNRAPTHIRAGNGVHAAYLERRVKEEGILKWASFACNPLHQAILHLEKKAIENPALKVLFTNSEMVKTEVLQYYSIDPCKIQVVHNGVEWQAMQQPFDQWSEQRESLCRASNLDPDALQLLFIGHNFRRKGLEKLLVALSLLPLEHFQLSVIGRDKNAPYFIRLAQRLGMEKKVFFFGTQQQALPFYQIADCLCIPSLYDPFANVTVEALAMCLFVISSKTNGGHEILNSENGTIIDDLLNPSSLVHALNIALQHRKTPQSARLIRQSVQHLDFSKQLHTLIESL